MSVNPVKLKRLLTLEELDSANCAKDIAFGNCVNKRNNGIELLLFKT